MIGGKTAGTGSRVTICCVSSSQGPKVFPSARLTRREDGSVSVPIFLMHK